VSMRNLELVRSMNWYCVIVEHTVAADSNEATVTASSVETPRKAVLSHKLQYVQASLARARVSLFRMKTKQSTGLHSSVHPVSRRRVSSVCNSAACTCNVCQQLQSLPDVQRNFICSQLAFQHVSKFGNRYSDNDKLFALGLYYKSPTAYRFMSKSFQLPSERTLRDYIGQFSVHCGFDSDYWKALEKHVESMSNCQRYCVLTFDGMSLRSKLQYSESKDKVTGYVDLADFGEVSSEPAKEALQFMVRGVSSCWKQPVGHFFIGTTVKAELLREMLHTVVTKLESIGLHVVAIVCDQQVSHRSLFSLLGVSIEQPWFSSSNGSRIYAMFDMPHIMKNLRNNFMNYDIVVDDNVASFSYVRQMYEYEKCSNLRMCPKLTDDHFDLKPFKKMRVSLATQVLSHSVAVALRAYAAFEKLPADASCTADFVERIDLLFDILNSRTAKIDHKFKKPLTANSDTQFSFLSDSIEWIAKWKFVHRAEKKEKASLPFHTGLLLTVKAVQQLAMFLLAECNFKYVLTSRFNQDVVENWFACIRQKGLNNDSRTVWEYESASKSVCVNWLLQGNSSRSNCELDFDKFVGMINSQAGKQQSPGILKSPLSTASAASENVPLSDDMCRLSDDTESLNDYDNDFDICTDWCHIHALTDVDSNVVAYIAGYMMRKASRRSNCENCLVEYSHCVQKTRDGLYDNDAHAQFVKLKTYDWAKHGLLVPSPALFNLCCTFERIISFSIEQLCYSSKVAYNLKQCIFTSVDLYSFDIDCACQEHKRQQLDYFVRLYCRVRIHHYVRIRNRELKQFAQTAKLKRSRKAKKVSHS